MNMRPRSVLVLALLLAGCSAGAASPAPPTSTPTSPPPSASGPPSTSPWPSVEIKPDRAACGRPGQALTVQQAGACYLAISEPVNLAMPPLVRIVLVDEPDPELVRGMARDAVEAMTTSSAVLLDRRWPAAVAAPVREIGEGQQRMLAVVRKLAADTTPAQILQDREALLAARGDVQAGRDRASAVRRALGLPPIQ
jgi:hypothetical protein